MTEEEARCHLRSLYRQLGENGISQVRAEYDKLGITTPLENILSSAWIEGRELAGWAYDMDRQCWRRADGSVVVNDDGKEWL